MKHIIANNRHILQLTQSELRRKASHEINYPVTIDGEEFEAIIEIDNISIGNDGIGAYEYWGARGFDKGHDYIEDFSIEDVTIPERPLTPEEEKAVILQLRQNKHFNRHVEETISIEPEEPDPDRHRD